MLSNLHDFSRELIKINTDVHFGREAKERLDQLVTSNDKSAALHGISPNEILTYAWQNRAELQAQLEKMHPGVQYRTDVAQEAHAKNNGH